jgi:polar amino acid transport system substrate-binding protein
MKFRSPAAAGAVLLAAALGVSACSSGSGGASSAAANKYGTVHNGQLTVVTSSDLTPFAYIKSGQWVGFDVELARQLGAKLGLKVTFSDHDFDTLLPLVSNGQADITLGSIADTDARRQTVDFTLPDYTGTNNLVVLNGSSIKAQNDLTGKKVGVTASSLESTYAKKYFTKSNIVTFPNNNAVMLALRAKNVDSMLIDGQTAQIYAKQYPVHTAFTTVDPKNRGAAWVISKKESKLREALNAQLRNALKDGTIQRLLKKWDPAEPAGPVIDFLKKYYAHNPNDAYPVS